MAVITIRGQLGSGAPEIGQILAGILGYRYIDQEVIARVAGKAERSFECIAGKEMPAASLAGIIYESINNSYPAGMARDGAYITGWEFPLEDKVYSEILQAVIRDFALKENVVILGRGSQFILKNSPAALHVLTVAPLDLRIKRVMAAFSVDSSEANKMISLFDGSRRQFIKKYFCSEIENPVNYNLVINTAKLSFEEAAQLALHNLQLMD